MACYLHFSLSGICIISVILHIPATSYCHETEHKILPFSISLQVTRSNLHWDDFWVETRWVFDTNNLYWGRRKKDLLSDNFHLLRGKYPSSSLMIFHISDEQVCHKQVQSKLGTKIMKQPCPWLQHWTCSLSLPPWSSASVEQASACAVVEMNLCWLAHGLAKGLRCICLSVGPLSCNHQTRCGYFFHKSVGDCLKTLFACKMCIKSAYLSVLVLWMKQQADRYHLLRQEILIVTWGREGWKGNSKRSSGKITYWVYTHSSKSKVVYFWKGHAWVFVPLCFRKTGEKHGSFICPVVIQTLNLFRDFCRSNLWKVSLCS